MRVFGISSYGGIDWSDSTYETKFLKENDSYDVQSDFDELIAKDVFKSFEAFAKDLEIENEHTYEDILKATKEKSKDVISLERYVHGHLDQFIEYLPDKEERIINGLGGQISYHYYYFHAEIPDENVVCLAVENFRSVAKGRPSVTRFYHKPVKTPEEAQELLDKMELHSDLCWNGSVKELHICDITKIAQEPWYVMNMAAIALKEEIKFNYEHNKKYNPETEKPEMQFDIYAQIEIRKTLNESEERYQRSLKRKQDRALKRNAATQGNEVRQ